MNIKTFWGLFEALLDCFGLARMLYSFTPKPLKPTALFSISPELLFICLGLKGFWWRWTEKVNYQHASSSCEGNRWRCCLVARTADQGKRVFGDERRQSESREWSETSRVFFWRRQTSFQLLATSGDAVSDHGNNIIHSAHLVKPESSGGHGSSSGGYGSSSGGHS